MATTRVSHFVRFRQALVDFGAESAVAKERQPAASFVPVRLPLLSAAPIEVMHRDGHLIRLPIGFDPVSLGHLLQALEARSAAAEA